MGLRKTVVKTILATLAVYGLAAIVVIGTVNPFGSFWGDGFPTATPITRVRKTKLFEAWQRTAPVEGLILGASKSMKLSPKRFSDATGLRFFNYSLSAGSLEDVRIVLDLVKDRAARPRAVVIGVDAQMLTRAAPSYELLSDWEFARRLEERPATLGWKIEHGAGLVRDALTPWYARAVGTSITAKLEGKEPLHHFYADGYLDYRTRDRAIAAGTYPRARMIAACAREAVDSLRAQHPFDRARVALLDSILASARADGIQATVWLTPYHPLVFEGIARDPELDAWMRSVPDTVRRIAAAHGAAFVNLQTIDTFDGDPTDFYDCAHFGNANAERITQQLLRARAVGAPAVASSPPPRSSQGRRAALTAEIRRE
jgi:hypothetical protein